MASEVKRYTTVCELGCETRGVEHKNGEWVDHEDYATLLARCEQAEATVAACKACMNDLLASPKGVVPQSCERFYRNGAFDVAAEAARGGEQNA
jgi:hypothetical protein